MINMKRIVVLDAGTLGDDLSLLPLEAEGAVTVYRVSPPETVRERITGADAVILNKVKIGEAQLPKTNAPGIICVAATGFDNIDIAAAREGLDARSAEWRNEKDVIVKVQDLKAQIDDLMMLRRALDSAKPSFCCTNQLLTQSHLAFRNLPCIAVVAVLLRYMIQQKYGQHKYKHSRTDRYPNSYFLFDWIFRSCWFHSNILCVVAIYIERHNKQSTRIAWWRRFAAKFIFIVLFYWWFCPSITKV